MRRFLRFTAAASALLAFAACSNAGPPPPVGSWRGAYEDSAVMIVARLKIDSRGQVRVAAPNAIIDPAGTTENERADLRARLEAGLAQSWPSVAPLPLEFDGRVFHKPGGVAPQLEWDGAEKRMTMVFYSGNRTAIRVKLDPIQE